MVNFQEPAKEKVWLLMMLIESLHGMSDFAMPAFFYEDDEAFCTACPSAEPLYSEDIAALYKLATRLTNKSSLGDLEVVFHDAMEVAKCKTSKEPEADQSKAAKLESKAPAMLFLAPSPRKSMCLSMHKRKSAHTPEASDADEDGEFVPDHASKTVAHKRDPKSKSKEPIAAKGKTKQHVIGVQGLDSLLTEWLKSLNSDSLPPLCKCFAWLLQRRKPGVVQYLAKSKSQLAVFCKARCRAVLTAALQATTRLQGNGWKEGIRQLGKFLGVNAMALAAEVLVKDVASTNAHPVWINGEKASASPASMGRLNIVKCCGTLFGARGSGPLRHKRTGLRLCATSAVTWNGNRSASPSNICSRWLANSICSSAAACLPSWIRLLSC